MGYGSIIKQFLLVSLYFIGKQEITERTLGDQR